MTAQGRDWTKRDLLLRHNRKTESGTRSECFEEKWEPVFQQEARQEGLGPFRDTTKAGRLCRGNLVR